VILVRDHQTFETNCTLVEEEEIRLTDSIFNETDRAPTRARGSHQRLFPNLDIRLPRLRVIPRGFGVYMEMNYRPYESHGVSQSLIGTRIGLVLKNQVFFGVGGWGNLSLATRHDSLAGQTSLAGYGGLELGYLIGKNLRVSMLAGAGINTTVESAEFSFLTAEGSGNYFFLLEPRVSFLWNLRSAFSLVVSYSRRWVDGDTYGNFPGSKLGFGLLIRIK
jgi:hypothetical protein